MIFCSYPANVTSICTTGFTTFACVQTGFEKLRFDCIEATWNGGLNEVDEETVRWRGRRRYD
jgi:alkyl hydroperoxide reductase subunit AhpC